jgi:alanine racemase
MGADVDTSGLNSWIEISASAHAHNLRSFRQRVGEKVELSAVVKANAYGHGLETIAALALEHGADSFCVHSLDEALRLRRAGFGQDVLIMGAVPRARLGEVVAEDFRQVLFNRETAEGLAAAAAAAGKRARVHLKIETGTHRQGIERRNLPAFVEFFHRHPELEPEGAYTHFANIEDTTRHDYALSQLDTFRAALLDLAAAGIEPTCRHTACSAATLLFPETHYDMVRMGVSQYGLWSSKETLLSYQLEHGTEAESPLRPVLSWKARISQVKDVPADAFIGYGCTYQTTRATRIAVLPVGYSNGYDRLLSNRAWVLIHGRRAPVRGRVCMNLIMVDVTDIPDVAVEDEAVLLGRQGEQEIRAEELADLAGTIPYEIVARLDPGLERVLVD